MGCCVCAGSCNHVGPCSYCTNHGGANIGPMMPSWWYSWPSQPTCEHCWCREAAQSVFAEGPHRQCCKCLTQMAEQFIPSLNQPTEDHTA